MFESSHPTNNDLTAFHVCKPTTNQFQALPDPEFDYSTCKAAIVIIGVEPLRYKIFRVSYVSTWSPEDDCDDFDDWYAFEIFDSKSWSWCESDTIRLPPYESPNNELIASKGKMYMLLDSGNIFPSPHRVGDPIDYDHKILSKHVGNLGFDCHHSNGFWDHWVLMGEDL